MQSLHLNKYNNLYGECFDGHIHIVLTQSSVSCDTTEFVMITMCTINITSLPHVFQYENNIHDMDKHFPFFQSPCIFLSIRYCFLCTNKNVVVFVL